MPKIFKYQLVIACDHGGVELKDVLYNYLSTFTIKDLGVQVGETIDYPIQAKALVSYILNGEAEKGILICGSGLGMSIAANRFNRIRATLCHEEYTARMSRKHNDSNVLVLGGRTIGVEVAKGIVDVWMNTDFDGGRHARRIAMMDNITED